MGLAESGWVIEEQVWSLEGLPLKVRVCGRCSSWHLPRVWSLFSGSLALDSEGVALDTLGLGLWLPSFLGFCFMVAVPGGDVMACYLGKPPGQVGRNGRRLKEFSFKVTYLLLRARKIFGNFALSTKIAK